MKYATIVADPPWRVGAGPVMGPYKVGVDGKQLFGDTGGPSRPLAYATMSVPEICQLPVRDLALPDAHLYLWTINRYIREAFDVVEAWGFAFSTLLTWAKRPMGGGLGGAFGISTEHCLFCRRGSLPAMSRVVGTSFAWKRPYENGFPKHSAKPPEFLAMVEAVSPGPRIELFARSQRPGWAVWGDGVGLTGDWTTPQDVARCST